MGRVVYTSNNRPTFSVVSLSNTNSLRRRCHSPRALLGFSEEPVGRKAHTHQARQPLTAIRLELSRQNKGFGQAAADQLHTTSNTVGVFYQSASAVPYRAHLVQPHSRNTPNNITLLSSRSIVQTCQKAEPAYLIILSNKP